MSEQWTDERIAKEAEHFRFGAYTRTATGWEHAIKGLLLTIRDDMQAEIDSLLQQNEVLRHQLDELAKLAIQQPTTPRTEADYHRKRCRQLMEENDRLHKQSVETQNQARKNWIALLRAIASTDAEWKDADDASLMEQFDPYEAIHQQLAIEGGQIITIADSNVGVAVHCLNDDLRLCRLVEPECDDRDLEITILREIIGGELMMFGSEIDDLVAERKRAMNESHDND